MPWRFPDRGLMQLLEPYRVLDLTDAKGFLCGKLLGDLGADVVKIEPPGGEPSRRFPPYYLGEPHPERSLYWWAYNSNKRGITLNLESERGRALFHRILAKADVLVESFDPGHLSRLRLGYPELRRRYPGLIVVSITPFGQTGPYAGYKTSDLISMATGGIVYVSGDPDRPPVRVSQPQAYLHGGAEAAVGTMMAILERESSGEGQHVDVSIQESLVSTAVSSVVTWDITGGVQSRQGAIRSRGEGRVTYRLVWPCKDGYVVFTRLYGPGMNAATADLVSWLEAEGVDVGDLGVVDWDTFDIDRLSQERADALFEPLGGFFARRTKAELFDGAVARRIPLYPVNTMEDLLVDRQLQARGLFQQIEHPELGESILYPVEHLKVHPEPIEIRRRAPLIGEHNLELYQGELSLSLDELRDLEAEGVI